MLNVYFAIAANRVVIDSMTNMVSIIDLFEQLKVPSFPVLVPRLTLLYYVSRDNNDPETKALNVVGNLGDSEIFNIDVQVDFKGEDSTRIVLGIDGLTLTQPGLFQASLLDQKQSLGVLDLVVEQAKVANLNAAVNLSTVQ